MREILTPEAYQRQKDWQGILSVFSGEVFRRESRNVLIEEGKDFLNKALGRNDIRSQSVNGDIVLLCAGLLKRATERRLADHV